MTPSVRTGLLSLVVGVVALVATPGTASAQFVGSVTVYDLPSYAPVAPVTYYGPSPIVAPVVQFAPVAPVVVARPVVAPVVVQSAYYAPAPIVPVYSYPAYSSYYVAPLPRHYTARYRSTPYGYVVRERAW